MSKHPVEILFNASAHGILTAIEHGFRAQVDVKGKLAELFLYKELERLVVQGTILGVTWQDKDGRPDFLVQLPGRELRVECKNVRTRELFKSTGHFKVELQKTRNSKDGTPTRAYRNNEFD